ncbi:MAG: leucine-rich repeat domain-containing protein [Eubacteriaceae bacterium]|nr:leucine-rich repeat domain-containing protein [Eubacteriaceae bacterium]
MDFLIEDGTLKRIREPGEKVIIPEGVERISQSVFSYRSGIRRVMLPSTLKRIDDWGFSNCRDLEELEIPNGVTCIGHAAFMGCNSLRRIILPAGLTELANDCFSYCRSLAEVALPSSLKTIGRLCFFHAENLCEIHLPEGLEEIGYQAFRCTSLREVTVPSSLRTMGRGAFSDDPGIRINLSDSIGCVPNDMCIIFATGVETVERFTAHSVSVTDHVSGETLLCVPMFPDESDAWMKVLNRVWGDLSRFDMAKVDSAFGLIRSYETKRDVALFRLRNDVALAPGARETYLKYVKDNEERIVSEILRRDDPSMLDFMASVGALSDSALDGYIRQAGELKATVCCAYLMERSRSASGNDDSLSLEGLW